MYQCGLTTITFKPELNKLCGSVYFSAYLTTFFLEHGYHVTSVLEMLKEN